jgi:hypothetical protein
MMIVAFERYDGQSLGAEKIGEGSGERDEKIGEFLSHHIQHPRTSLSLSLTISQTNLTQLQIHQCFLPKQTTSKNR